MDVEFLCGERNREDEVWVSSLYFYKVAGRAIQDRTGGIQSGFSGLDPPDPRICQIKM